ncbi:hypothetical protein NM688_g5908 [Phlebia brevispora]|uniref:Uncharacterized protein n=1 Tax=Phlebia brevispora TaxID=194682 RepID=A0ACC1SMS6_9APHY|nr:hypothetical protein NM688_g5908 [Phlebia brevispora]
MKARPAQKRHGSSEESSQHATKKTRFVEPEDDPANFAEEVDAQLEDPMARRKGRVKTEGYESDSSDDGEGVVYSRRHEAEEKDEDEDMFAVGEKEEKKEEDTGKKKKEEFLRLGDIEGQEFGEPSGSGAEESSESEGEPEDEDDEEDMAGRWWWVGKSEKAAMGRTRISTQPSSVASADVPLPVHRPALSFLRFWAMVILELHEKHEDSELDSASAALVEEWKQVVIRRLLNGRDDDWPITQIRSTQSINDPSCLSVFSRPRHRSLLRRRCQ